MWMNIGHIVDKIGFGTKLGRSWWHYIVMEHLKFTYQVPTYTVGVTACFECVVASSCRVELCRQTEMYDPKKLKLAGGHSFAGSKVDVLMVFWDCL